MKIFAIQDIPGIRTQMKPILFFLFLQFACHFKLISQCNTYIQMVDVGVEGCVLPVIVNTQQLLLPCSAPAEFYQLEKGDFGYVEYTLSACANICLLGPEVDITCFSFPVDTKDQTIKEGITIFPNPVQEEVFIKGEDIIQVRLYSDTGIQMLELNHPDITHINTAGLNQGVYFLQVLTSEQTYLKRFVKV
jgi:hypothetical protein